MPFGDGTGPRGQSPKSGSKEPRYGRGQGKGRTSGKGVGKKKGGKKETVDMVYLIKRN